MKLRLMGLPAEVDQVDGRYPNRDNSRMVRVYIEAQLCADGRADP